MLADIRKLGWASEFNYTDNQNEKTQSMEKCYDFRETYNGCVMENMMGFTLFYDGETNNIATSSEQLNNLNKLYDIKKLEKNWNGYGGLEIDNVVIERAEIFIKNICRQPKMFPTGRNSIQMQYELEDKSYLEFEIYEEKVMCMKVPKRIYKNAVFEKFEDIEIKKLNQIVKEFYER